jgi:hypothetical protein
VVDAWTGKITPAVTETLVSKEFVSELLCDEDSVVPEVVAFDMVKEQGALELHSVIGVMAPWMPGTVWGSLSVLTALHWLGSNEWSTLAPPGLAVVAASLVRRAFTSLLKFRFPDKDIERCVGSKL